MHIIRSFGLAVVHLKLQKVPPIIIEVEGVNERLTYIDVKAELVSVTKPLIMLLSQYQMLRAIFNVSADYLYLE